MILKHFLDVFKCKRSKKSSKIFGLRPITKNTPPLFSDPRKQGGGGLFGYGQNPKNVRAFGAILLPFFMNFSYILHVFDTRNDRFSSCVSIFSRLRRTFLPKFILQTREGAGDCANDKTCCCSSDARIIIRAPKPILNASFWGYS